jgi:hypothetical protein
MSHSQLNSEWTTTLLYTPKYKIVEWVPDIQAD